MNELKIENLDFSGLKILAKIFPLMS